MQLLWIMKFITIIPENLSINNISLGGVSQKLIRTNRGGGGGSQVAKIELMLYMDSPYLQHNQCLKDNLFAIF